MPLQRRDWLRRASLLTSWGLVGGCGKAAARRRAGLIVRDGRPFEHGVASGDPLQTQVILWTRVSHSQKTKVKVAWWVRAEGEPGAKGESNTKAAPVAQGVFETGPERDYTVKVDVQGLLPGRRYTYGFEVDSQASPIGRTKTLPSESPQRVTLAVASCANLPAGYFNAYAHMAADPEIDLVVHLGDYLYEYANGVYGDGRQSGRMPRPVQEALTLADYRERHASYKEDLDLQQVHATHPFVAIWDDHELANNASWTEAENHSEGEEGQWTERRDAAARAYLEWMPIREAQADGRPMIYRELNYGSLLNLVMLDTRLVGRDPAPSAEELAAGQRGASLLGATQRKWLDARRRSPARWQALGQQVFLAPLREEDSSPAMLDTWNGYPEARAWMYAWLAGRPAGSNVVLTGDVHASWANEIRTESWGARTQPLLAVEFVTPGISSPGLAGPWWNHEPVAFLKRHPHVRWAEWTRQGYMRVVVTHEQVQSSWIHVDTVERRVATAKVVQRARLEYGGAQLELLPA